MDGRRHLRDRARRIRRLRLLGRAAVRDRGDLAHGARRRLGRGGLSSFMLLREIPENGRLVVFTVLIAVFADDTAAYVVGRTIGRHKMAPTISPGKSWEGFVGGTLAAMAVAFFAMYDQGYLTDLEAVALGAAIAISSTLGDLFESAIKRDLGVKDSGRILAGHGGVLDRVDSILWAGPAAFYVVLALT